MLSILKKKSRGFTLIEILIVIGIIAILAAIVIIAINPAKQFAQARNSQRTANVNAILNAIGQRIADNKGVFEGSFIIGTNTYNCGKLPTNVAPTSSVNTTAEVLANIGVESSNFGCLVPTYIPTLPNDPQAAAGPDTEYEIVKDGSGRVTVCAPKAAIENSIPNASAICVTR